MPTEEVELRNQLGSHHKHDYLSTVGRFVWSQEDVGRFEKYI